MCFVHLVRPVEAENLSKDIKNNPIDKDISKH